MSLSRKEGCQLVIRTNIAALQAYRHFGLHQQQVVKAMQRLSSGYRINSAADDAAGLAISERMRGQIRGMRMASRNAMDAISMLQTAEGGLNETHAILHRMRELPVQAANGTYSAEDRMLIEREYEAIRDEISRIASATHYNNMRLLDGTAGAGQNSGDMQRILGFDGGDITLVTGGYEGAGRLLVQELEDGSFRFILDTAAGYAQAVLPAGTASGSVTLALEDGTQLQLNNLDTAKLRAGVLNRISFRRDGVGLEGASAGAKGSQRMVYQVGANGGGDQRIYAGVDDMSAYSLGNGSTYVYETDISTPESAREAIDVLDKAVNQVSAQRASIGAQINRLEHTISYLENSIYNLEAAESRIRDADMAEEMMNLMKHSILMQAAQAMMAQANNLPRLILQMIEASTY